MATCTVRALNSAVIASGYYQWPMRHKHFVFNIHAWWSDSGRLSSCIFGGQKVLYYSIGTTSIWDISNWIRDNSNSIRDILNSIRYISNSFRHNYLELMRIRYSWSWVWGIWNSFQDIWNAMISLIELEILNWIKATLNSIRDILKSFIIQDISNNFR